MALITVIAAPGTYFVSIGAMIDSFARLSESYVSNAGLKDYSRPHTRLMLASMDDVDSIRLATGRQLACDGKYVQARDVNIVYLPSFQVADPDRLRDHILAPGMAIFHQWLAEVAQTKIAIGACGAAVCHLAAAGLLNDRPARIHPRLEHAFGEMFPLVRKTSEPAVAVSGTIFTCAIDADSPKLVEKLFECAVSPVVSRSLVRREPFNRRGDLAEGSCDPLVLQSKMWLHDHFAQSVRIADLAARFGVTHQTLIRRFRAAGEGTPRAYLQRARLESAAAMLSETRRAIGEIAQLVGYSDVASFRRTFYAAYALSPLAYRKRRQAEKRIAQPSQ